MSMSTYSKYSEHAKLSVDSSLLSDDIYQNLLENCFGVLTGQQESPNLNHDTASNEIAKAFHAFLLIITSDFVRQDESPQEIEEFLLNSCNIVLSRVQKYLEYYTQNKINIQSSLLNIGNYLPHLTDVQSTMDYVVKSSMIEDSEGPLFRISLSTEKYDNFNQCKKVQNINFTCTGQELQDLIYKIKDALRHCNTLMHRSN